MELREERASIFLVKEESINAAEPTVKRFLEEW